MHDDRINCVVFNAFNGLGDTTGGDDYGVSVAWIDLDDHLEPEGLDHYELYPYSDDVSVYVKTHPAINGARYCLAFWYADGSREILACESHDAMMEYYRAYEASFMAWCDSADDN